MGKKGRRQGDPDGDKREASDSSEDNKAVCPHAKKFKNKSQKTNKITIVAACKDCNDTKSKVQVEENTLEESSQQENAGEVDLLVCLFCASVGCGDNGKGHALAHQKTVRSDCHDFAFDIKKETIWCFLCQKEVQSTSLKNSMKALQKKIEAPSRTNAPQTEIKSPNKPTPFLNKEVCIANRKKPLVKGLMNLGNTCFFNSVLQCLAQTPYLLSVLERLSAEGEKCTIPGNDKLEPIKGELIPIESKTGGLLGVRLLDLLKRMTNRESNTVERPDQLLQCLKKRYEQFQGREQHDAHELLRHLLEGVRTDDLKRFQRVILTKFDCFGRKDKPPDSTARIIRRYGFLANDLPLGPDILFRGELISTLKCQDCHNTSTRPEHFLDLSLPVTEEKPVPPVRKKDMDYNTGPSKNQLRKEKKEKKRAKKLAARQAHSLEKVTSPQTQDPAGSNNESDDSDADVEDNVEPDTSLPEKRNDIVESGYSSEKAQNGDSAKSVSPAESGCAEGEHSISIEVEPDDSVPQTTEDISGNKEVEPPLPFIVDDTASNDTPSQVDPASYTLPLINEIPASPTPSPSPTSPPPESDEDVFDFQLPCNLTSYECERSDATINCAESDTAGDMPKCSPTEGGDGDDGAQSCLDMDDLQKRLSSLKCAENCASDGSVQTDKVGASKDVAKDSNSSSWTRTLAPKITISEGECSLLSCLNQFTAIEVMSGINKVSCDNCAKNKGKDGQTVHTKQLLISAPPAILIIQFKRFIADGSRLKKMYRGVSFPLSLDLAPFCSVKCRELPSVRPDQTEIRYSLYGVVEHSGQMGSGHYVAYVKVRPSLGDQDPRWSFLAPGRPFLQTRQNSELAEPSESSCSEEKWYYISDSQVSAVDEEKVRRSQAYLLFYERVA